MGHYYGSVDHHFVNVSFALNNVNRNDFVQCLKKIIHQSNPNVPDAKIERVFSDIDHDYKKSLCFDYILQWRDSLI